MRQEHEKQFEIPGLPEAGPVFEQAQELSDVARLSAEVIDKGLIREHRPVFIYDKKLAAEKSGNAARQAKFREKQAEKGIVKADIPAALLEQVRVLGGWPEWIAAQKKVEIQEKTVIKEVLVAGKDVPGPVVYKDKIIEKPVMRITAEQKRALKVGEQAVALIGWRLKIARWLIGF